MKPSLHLGRNMVNTYAIRNTKLLSGIEDSHHELSDAIHNPPQPLKIDVNNKDKKETYAKKVTEFVLVMQTTKAGSHDSEACLNEGTCLPLGGFSGKRIGYGRWFLDVLLLHEKVVAAEGLHVIVTERHESRRINNQTYDPSTCHADELTNVEKGSLNRYVVPTGRVIATISIKVLTGSKKKSRFGGNEESKKIRKSMLKQEFADFKISESEGLHKGYDSSSTNSSVGATADSKCQPSSVSYTTTSSSADASGNVLENVLHSFVAESDPQQQITYEDFDQIGNYAARFDKKKVMCYQCSELGHFARESIGKKVDSKTSEDIEKGAFEVYGMIAGYGDDAVIPAVDAADGVNGVSVTSSDATDAETQFALMGLSPQTKFGLGYGDTFRSDEVFDLSAPSIFDSCLKDALEKPLYDRFIKAVGLHAVPGPITGTFMPPSNKPDIDDNTIHLMVQDPIIIENYPVSNDFVSCDNSDKSSDSETTGFASCVSSVKSSSLKTKDQLASASSSVDLKTLHKTDDQGPCNYGIDQTYVPLGRTIFLLVGIYPPARPMTRQRKAIIFNSLVGLAHITKWIWMGEDGELLLRPQQVVLGKETGHICIGDPRTMVDLNNLQGQPHRQIKILDKEFLVLSKEFQLPDSSQVVLRVPRTHNLYCFNLTDIHSEKEIKCLLAKASLDESTKWHRRMAHVNFKNMNKLAKHGLVNGLPSKLF
ncbi:putative ribonuclease H-like domain-containing protein [Tanacetum coccineum]